GAVEARRTPSSLLSSTGRRTALPRSLRCSLRRATCTTPRSCSTSTTKKRNNCALHLGGVGDRLLGVRGRRRQSPSTRRSTLGPRDHSGLRDAPCAVHLPPHWNAANYFLSSSVLIDRRSSPRQSRSRSVALAPRRIALWPKRFRTASSV